MADGTQLNAPTIAGGEKIFTRDTGNADGKIPVSFILADDAGGVETYASFGSGVADGGTLRTILASDQPPLPISHAALTELGLAIDVDKVRSSVVDPLPQGNNNIGDVDVVSLPALPAGGNLIGSVGVASLPGTVAADITAIKTAVELLDNAVSGNELQVDVLSLPTLVLGAGTNNIGDVDVLSLPALPAGTNNIGDVDVATLPAGSLAAAAAVTRDYDTGGGTETLTLLGIALPAAGGAVAGGTLSNPLRVDPTGTTPQPVSGSVSIASSLPAGNANIGDVDVVSLPALPAGDNNIGNVDVVTLPSLPAGSNNIGDVDVLTLPDVTIADILDGAGDSIMDAANNALRVNVVAGGGGSGGGGVAHADDSPFTPGATNFTPAGGVYQSTADLVDDGDAGAVRMTARRALYVSHETPSGDSLVDDSADALKVSVVTSLAAGTANIGDVDVASLPGTVAADITAIKTAVELLDNAISGSELQVDVLTMPTTTVQATNLDIRDLNQAADSVTAHQGGSWSFSLAAAVPAGTNNIGDVDVASLPGTVAADITAIKTAVELLDNAVSGNELQIDVVTLPTIALGASTNNIGDVDVLTLPDVTVADIQDGAGDSVMDAANNAIRVNLVAGGGAGGSSQTDEAAFTAGASNLTIAGGVYQATPEAVTDGQGGAVRMTANRSLHVTPETPNGDTMVDDFMDAMRVNVVAGSAAGTEYFEGDVEALIFGKAIMWEDTGDTLRVVSAAKPLPVTGISSALPTGASTEAKQDTMIGHLDGVEGLLTTIDADTGALAGCVGGTELQVDVVSSALPTGAATAANQATVIGHLDGVEGLLTTIDGDTGSLAGCVSGTELQVDVLTMPTTTVQATDLDVRDLAQASDSVRIYANTAKDGSGTAYIPLVDADGHLQADVLSSALPTGAATAANQTTIIGHLDGVEGLLTTIDGDTGTLAGCVSGTEVQVDVMSSALPTGAATAANQTTMIGHLDGVEGLLTTIDGDTGSLAGCVSGSELQVDVVSLPNEGQQSMANSISVAIASDQSAVPVKLTPQTSGGMLSFRSIDLDESEEEVKATAGQVYGWFLFNNAASVRFVKFYNATAASVSVGTTTPQLTIPLPAGSAANVPWPDGIEFTTAITVAATTGVADSDTGAPSANDVVANIFYK